MYVCTYTMNLHIQVTCSVYQTVLMYSTYMYITWLCTVTCTYITFTHTLALFCLLLCSLYQQMRVLWWMQPNSLGWCLRDALTRQSPSVWLALAVIVLLCTSTCTCLCVGVVCKCVCVWVGVGVWACVCVYMYVAREVSQSGSEPLLYRHYDETF